MLPFRMLMRLIASVVLVFSILFSLSMKAESSCFELLHKMVDGGERILANDLFSSYHTSLDNFLNATYKNNEALILSNNRVIDFLYERLERKGIYTRVVENEFEYTGLKFKIKQLELVSGVEEERAASYLNRLKKRLGVEQILFDLVENDLKETGGHFVSSKKQIAIGIGGLLDILELEEGGGTAMHEFSHAAFERLRQQGKHSIYSMRFYASSTKKLGESKYYPDYMSAEELYNFAAQGWWDSKWLADFNSFDAKTSMSVLAEIRSNLRVLDEVTRQSNELSSSFLARAQWIKDNNRIYFKRNWRLSDDHIEIHFWDEMGRRITFYLDEEKRALAEEFWQRNIKLQLWAIEEELVEDSKGASELFIKNYKEIVEQIPPKLRSTFDQLYSDVVGYQTNIMDLLSQDLRQLLRVSEQVNMKEFSIFKELEEIKKIYEVYIQNADHSADEVKTMQRHFNQLRRSLREFAVIAREGAGDFAGSSADNILTELRRIVLIQQFSINNLESKQIRALSADDYATIVRMLEAEAPTMRRAFFIGLGLTGVYTLLEALHNY